MRRVGISLQQPTPYSPFTLTMLSSHSSRSGLQSYAAHTRTKKGRVIQNRQLRIVQVEVGNEPYDSTSASTDSAISFASSRLRPVPQIFRGKQVTPSTDVYLGSRGDESSIRSSSGRPDPARCYYDNAESFYTLTSRLGEEAMMWRTYPAKAYIPRDKTKNASRKSLEESALTDFVSLAQDGLCGASIDRVQGRESLDSTINDQLYRLGILYDNMPTDTNTNNINDDETSPYQAAGLGSIQHSEPLYTVRHVTVTKSRRGHPRSAATPPLH